MKSLFSAPSTIQKWEWDGNMDCQTVLPIVTEDSKCVNIELDSDSLLFRSLNLRRSKNTVSQSKPPKRPVQNKTQEPDTTFLPAPIHKMSQQELKESLKRIGLQTTGTKAELMQRLDHFINGGKT
ncbi:hypothetical protein M9Y10_043677 [Tritrichomonas musculus]|uniref:SAP domain-containing protein n=1 Tax=Tritrichomonas musculus TaxID=1915356 RepID=A0ABR2K103_9EUKA